MPIGILRARRSVPLVVLVVLAFVLVRLLFVQVFVIPSPSMEPTLRRGDRVLVSTWQGRHETPRRGQVVVFDGTGLFNDDPVDRSFWRKAADGVGSFVGVSSRTMFVKRVIGLPGERVACCTSTGQLTVDGQPLDEPWLPGGTQPSRMTFDVVVPAGHYWMMGDNRDVSADSRAHLGSPGGGMVPRGRIVGPVKGVVWPPSRW